jgi:hypothetical protein
MGWQVRFIPDEVDHMTVSCNGQHALDWSSAEGDATKNIPAQWANLPHVHFVGEGSPNGRNAHMKILWDGQERHNMEFDNGEDWDS